MSELTLNERAFDPNLFKNGCNECAFCMDVFVEGQKTIVLPCDMRHYFHSDCILVWSRGHRNCPLCNVVFDERIVREFSQTLENYALNVEH